jgi:hypothetical protein
MLNWLFRRGSPKAEAAETVEEQRRDASDDDGAPTSIEVESVAYSTDAALEDISGDRFDRAPFANRIAQTIARRTDHACLAIGIYGAWGDGKTTTLNFIRGSLKNEGNIIFIPFNPWRIAGEDALLESFFATLADGLSAKLRTNTEEVGKLIKDYSFLLKPVAVLPGGDAVAAGLGTALSSVSLEKLRKRISTALRESNKRIVVSIDDIDRLDKTEIQALFRLIKLSADFENIAYILAFDDAMVAAALGEKFASDPAKHFAAGQNFLEKIIQVGLNLPPSTPEAVAEYTYELLNRVLNSSAVVLTQEEANGLAVKFQLGLLPLIKTPRMANRYANALEFSLGLLRYEVNAEDLILVEGLRTLYPKLYNAVRKDREAMIGVDRKNFDCRKFVVSAQADLSPTEQGAAVRLLNTLFPRTESTGYPAEWEKTWAREKRVCSESYFDRYFSYGIRSNDISDQTIDRVLELARLNDAAALKDELTNTISEKNSARLLEKLRAQESTLDPETSINLARAIAEVPNKFPKREGMAFFSSPSLQATILIRNLLKNVPAPERLQAAFTTLRSAASPRFICECTRWLSSSEENPDRLLTPTEDVEMRKFGAERLLEQLSALEAPIFQLEPKDAEPVLGMISWGLGRDAARRYVNSWFERSEDYIESYLVSFIPTAWSMETGIPFQSELRSETYRQICEFADCDLIEHYLRRKFGSEMDSPSYFGVQAAPFKRAANQFMYLRQAQQKDRREDVPNSDSQEENRNEGFSTVA